MAQEDTAVRALPSARLQWLLALLRPLWQLVSITLVLLQLPSDSIWARACLAVGVSLFIAMDVLLSTRLDDKRWWHVQETLLQFETWAVTILAVAMILWFPAGPGCLLLVPTAVTYAFQFRPQQLPQHPSWHRTAPWVPVVLTFVLVGMDLWRVVQEPHGVSEIVTVLFAMYALIACFAALVLWGVQKYLAERQEFQSMVGTLESQSQQLSRINEQVNDYANRVYDLATVEERNRIAGEIHDTVAHRLTALLVQLQAARRTMEAGDMESARNNFLVSEELARESLEEVRTSVRAIRKQEGGQGIEALKRLTLQYAALTGMTVEFTAAEEIHTLPGRLLAMLYRVLQEGLTNAQRHGRATRVDVNLSRQGPAMTLRIADNGKGAVNPKLGFGLSSMRNRLLPYGGNIAVASQPGLGFQLELTLPLWEGWPGD